MASERYIRQWYIRQWYIRQWYIRQWYIRQWYIRLLEPWQTYRGIFLVIWI
jgi:hypothetical protein